MMCDKGMIEILARGVCVMDGMLLLCYGRRSGVRYLPGGHVEFGERARQALEREMLEETGIKARAGRFLGCCEHAFVQDGVRHFEMNLIFEMRLPAVSAGREVTAVENWIGFQWQPLDMLDESGMEPAVLRGCLAGWLERPGGHCEGGSAWADAVSP
ncbi:MAG: NUDIX domain-containing protein [Kiritimatiellae bacterium]|nr:NUDIX domain-containing protein [Kiritimatiellia bacterium]MDD4025387.1 NUDIX domain-containing protein [Kiritimatiellia bacterium]